MLHSVFSKAVFCSHLFIVTPFVSYQHPFTPAALADNIPVNALSSGNLPLNQHMASYAQNYIEKNSEVLAKIKQRSHYPFKTMDRVLAQYGLPVQLKYLAVVESDLKLTALSPVGAAGPWQLMPETAKQLGLCVTSINDERRQYVKSTRAAAVYLRELYHMFDDWLLVMAAYNCGPGPVYTAIRKSGSRNFWSLQRYLPAESRDHVKKFIATHYYFEGRGSATTLTRTENLLYNSSLLSRYAGQKQTAAMKDDYISQAAFRGMEQHIASRY